MSKMHCIKVKVSKGVLKMTKTINHISKADSVRNIIGYQCGLFMCFIHNSLDNYCGSEKGTLRGGS